jgi:tmRNA-binding protein
VSGLPRALPAVAAALSAPRPGRAVAQHGGSEMFARITTPGRSAAARLGGSRLAAVAVGTLIAVLCGGASAASAAQRFAAPGASGGEPCAAATPCDIQTAVNGTADGDEVIVKPGDYGSAGAPLTGPLHTSTRVDLHGVVGQPRPRLFVTDSTQVINAGARTHYLEIDAVNTSSAFTFSGSADQMVVRQGGSGTACVLGAYDAAAPTVLRNSVCSAAGSGDAIFVDNDAGVATNAEVRNVTSVGASAVGVHLSVDAAGSATTLTATNVIAKGGTADIEASAEAATSATFNVDHSNFTVPATTASGGSEAINQGAANQSGRPPVFSNPAAGDFHEAAGSATIDAGANDPANGDSALDGNPRTVNGTTDIGADEFTVAPAVVTGPASATGPATAATSGTVNPNGAATMANFAYGKTAGYGSATLPQPVGSGAAPQGVTATIRGLSPATTYHYRLVATNPKGTSVGVDRTFTTAPDPFAGVTLRGRALKASRKGVVTVKLSSASAASGTLSLSDVLDTKTGHVVSAKRRRKRIVLGKKTFSVAAGQTKKVRIQLSKRALRLLKASTKLKATLAVAATDSFGTRKKTKKKVTLKR